MASSTPNDRVRKSRMLRADVDAPNPCDAAGSEGAIGVLPRQGDKRFAEECGTTFPLTRSSTMMPLALRWRAYRLQIYNV